METIDLSKLQNQIGYQFENMELLAESLRHRSYVNELSEKNIKDNETLEFLGDAVLNLVVGHLLMNQYPLIKEGDLSRMRAALVNELELSNIARRIHLGQYLQLGKGEIATDGWAKNSILADAFEAVLAAIYLDGGFHKAFDVIAAHFSSHIESMSTQDAHLDFKSRLQEITQSRHRVTPQYRIIQEVGPDHDKTFQVQLSVGPHTAEGVGKSKKAAEQDAAKNALAALEE